MLSKEVRDAVKTQGSSVLGQATSLIRAHPAAAASTR